MCAADCTPACGERKCGVDPVCGVACGAGCDTGDVCTEDGFCEPNPVHDAPLPARLADDTTEATGTLPGTFAVSDDGQAQYVLPLPVPLGAAGMQPDLALHYNSGAGIGRMGPGWSLSGFSTIARCAAPFAASDTGYPAPIEDDSSDTFCLDGARLVTTSGVYGGDGTHYRTEVDQLVDVVSRGSTAGGPDEFEVRLRNGRILRYGHRSDARDVARGVRREWMLSEIRDRDGNIVEVRYGLACRGNLGYFECTVRAPSELRYGIFRGNGVPHDHDRSVKFVYENRPDERRGQWRGQDRFEWRRLAKVEAYVGDELWRAYRLDYTTLSETSVLTSVRDCSLASGPEVCRTVATIDYNDNRGFGRPWDRNPVSTGFGNGVDSPFIGQTIVLDANGDGRDDILYPAPSERITCEPASDCASGHGNWVYKLAIAKTDPNVAEPFTVHDTGLGSMNYLGFPYWCISQGTVFDYDGDGRDDIASTCGLNPGTVLRSTGTGFQVLADVLPHNSDTSPLWLVDANGDTLVDVLVCSGANLDLYLGNGPGQGFATSPRTLPNFGHQGAPAPGRGAPTPCAAPLLIDIDNDGHADILKREFTNAQRHSDRLTWTERWKALRIDDSSASWHDIDLEFDDEVRFDEPYSEVYRWVFFDNDGAVAQPYAQRWQTKVLDANGDGLADILRLDESRANPVRLWINTGRGFGAAQRSTGGSPVSLAGLPGDDISRYEFSRSRVVDLNNDGLPELMIPTGSPRFASGWYALPISGTNRLDTSLIWTQSIAERSEPIVADIHGDGEVELVHMGRDSSVPDDEHGNRQNPLIVWNGTMARGLLATRFADGSGKLVDVAYNAETASGSRVYRATLGNPDRVWRLRDVGPLVSGYVVGTHDPDAPNDIRVAGSHELTYWNAHVGWYGRGFLGFSRRTTVAFDQAGEFLRRDVRLFDNDTYVAAVANTNLAHWYPYAGRLIQERTVFPAAPARLGGVQRQLGASWFADAWKIEYSDADLPFVELTGSKTRTWDVDTTPFPVPVERVLSQSTMSRDVDAYGNVTRREETWQNALGETIESVVSTADFAPTQARIDAWLVALPDSRSVARMRQGTSRSRTYSFTYSDTGRLASLERQPGGGPMRLLQTFGYDRFGNPTSVTEEDVDGAVRVTTTLYDERGFAPIRRINAQGHRTDVAHHPVHGQIVVARDANGVVQRWAYDGFGRARRASAPGYSATTRYRLPDTTDPAGAAYVVESGVAGRAFSRMVVDGLGRRLRDQFEGYGGKMVTQDYEYDDAGRLAATSTPYVFGDGDPAGWVRQTYDAAGRPVRIERPEDEAQSGVAATTIAYGLPGELSSAADWEPPVRRAAVAVARVTDARGHTRTTVFDHRRDIVATVDAIGGVTQHEYDPSGQLRTSWDAASDVTAAYYDALGRATTVVSPNAGTHTVAFDGFGQITSVTDNAGDETRYAYDMLGRVTQRVDPSGATAWTYDQGVSAIGRLSAAVSPDCHRTTYEYAPVPSASGGGAALAPDPGDVVIPGALTRTSLFVEGERFDTELSYDAFGRVTRVEYPPSLGRGFAVAQAYDRVGNLVSIDEASDARRLWTLVKDDLGYRPRVEQLGSSITRTSTYQPGSGRLESIESRVGGAPIQHLTYHFDVSGQLDATIDHVRAGESRIYRHDKLDRLTKVFEVIDQNPDRLGDLLREMKYDATGNLTYRSDVGAYTYAGAGSGAAPNRPSAVTAAGDNTYSYDANGNQTSRTGPAVRGGAQTIKYTPFDLPRQVTLGQGADRRDVHFEYNAGQQRVVERDGATVTVHLGQRYERITDDDGVDHLYHVFGPRGPIATVRRTDRDSGGPPAVAFSGTGARAGPGGGDTPPIDPPAPELTRFVLTDRLGTAHTVTDGAGGVLARPAIDEFGASRGTLDEATGDRGFTGHRHDTALGLVNMGGRIYDPLLGRFLSVDPIRHTPFSTQGSNAYSYVYNNPLSYTDPSGFCPSPKADRLSFPRCWSIDIEGAVLAFVGVFGTSSGGGSSRSRPRPKSSRRSLASSFNRMPFGSSAARIANRFSFIERIDQAARDLDDGISAAWEHSSTVDKFAFSAQAAPYFGDYVALVVSFGHFVGDPSWTSAGDLGLDFVGAVLPFVGALGTARRMDRAADAADDAVDAAREGADIVYRAPRAEARPGVVDEAMSPGEHVVGGKRLGESPWESWTSDPNVAAEFASRPGRTGEVISRDLSTVPSGQIGADLRTPAGRAAAAARETDPYVKRILESNQDSEVVIRR